MNMTSTRCTLITGGSSRPLIEMSCRKRQTDLPWGEFRHRDGILEDEESETTLLIAREITRKAMIYDKEPVTKVADSFYIELPQNVTAMDPVVLHTVQLNEYATNLEKMILEMYGAPDTPDDLAVYPAAPEIPRLIDPITKRGSNFPFVQFEREETDFSAGLVKPNLRLSIANARRFLKKSVATLLAHSGFEESSELALDVVTDVVANLYDTMSQRLRVAVDQEAVSGQNGFHDPLERVFTEMNLGSLEDLLRYYDESVIEYHDRLEEQCKDYAHEYSLGVESRLNGQNEAEQEEEFVPEEEEEGGDEDNDDEDVPEIHFPALDMEDQLGLQPSLEPGFQMLNSLEHDETLQNLDINEEMKRFLSYISECSNEPWKAKKKRYSGRGQEHLAVDTSQIPSCSSKDQR